MPCAARKIRQFDGVSTEFESASPIANARLHLGGESAARAPYQWWLRIIDAADTLSWIRKGIKAWGYMSTSTHADDGFGPIELRLTVPKGTKAIYVGWDSSQEKHTALSEYPFEEELILGSWPASTA